MSFDHAGCGLVAREDVLRGFAIAGEDRKFVWADAQIVGHKVVVSSPSISKPAVLLSTCAANQPLATSTLTVGVPTFVHVVAFNPL